LELPDGSHRTFLQDGDTVTISAVTHLANGTSLGFGEVTGTIEPTAIVTPLGMSAASDCAASPGS
jgi:fumarylacetoacetase